MSYNNEYTRPTVGYASCSYRQLKSYNPGPEAPVPARVPSMANTVVPNLCGMYPPPYDTLSHGGSNSCGGYFPVTHAYNSDYCENNPNQFVQRNCDGLVNCNVENYSRDPRSRRCSC